MSAAERVFEETLEENIRSLTTFASLSVAPDEVPAAQELRRAVVNLSDRVEKMEDEGPSRPSLQRSTHSHNYVQ